MRMSFVLMMVKAARPWIKIALKSAYESTGNDIDDVVYKAVIAWLDTL